MCGFAGILSLSNLPPNPSLLPPLSHAISHRGPDAQSSFTSSHALLTHARLAILDPDPRSNQPFPLHTQHLLYNGEIYNHLDLRKELTSLNPHYQWRTTGDTETLSLAYHSWRESCLPKLNGMFAFAIYDSSNHSLFLARDPTGQKPLFHTLSPDGNYFAFASELGALKTLPWLNRDIDQQALSLYLELGYIPSPHTIYQSTQKLPPSTWLRIQNNNPPESNHYSPSSNKQPATSNKQLPHLLQQSVTRQMLSDVPLGTFLSGGIDSSIITLCATRSSPHPVHTFSIGFSDPRYDETPHAREVAAHLKTTHHEFHLTPDAAHDLPLLSSSFGEPFADSSALPTYYLSRLTRDHVKVALSGDGADELFAGYDRYRAMRLLWRLDRLHLTPLLSPFASLKSHHPKSLLSRLRRLAQSAPLSPPERYQSLMTLFTPNQIAELLSAPPSDGGINGGSLGGSKGGTVGGDMGGTKGYLADIFSQFLATKDPVESSLATDLATYLPDDLHTKVDRASMRCALEVRAPFMDPDVLAYASQLHTHQLLAQGPKSPLRAAFAKDLPPSVFNRPKQGFAVPLSSWFQGPLLPLLTDSLLTTKSILNQANIKRYITEHTTGQSDHSQRLYALLMFQLWQSQETP